MRNRFNVRHIDKSNLPVRDLDVDIVISEDLGVEGGLDEVSLDRLGVQAKPSGELISRRHCELLGV
jgi:hypothetical protein